jgi:hypothetical protein
MTETDFNLRNVVLNLGRWIIFTKFVILKIWWVHSSQKVKTFLEADGVTWKNAFCRYLYAHFNAVQFLLFVVVLTLISMHVSFFVKPRSDGTKSKTETSPQLFVYLTSWIARFAYRVITNTFLTKGGHTSWCATQWRFRCLLLLQEGSHESFWTRQLV